MPKTELICHYCTLPIPEYEKRIEAKTKNAWAHFECWYDGEPFPRDFQTGEQLDKIPVNLKVRNSMFNWRN
jgi:hypothetical protein